MKRGFEVGTWQRRLVQLSQRLDAARATSAAADDEARTAAAAAHLEAAEGTNGLQLRRTASICDLPRMMVYVFEGPAHARRRVVAYMTMDEVEAHASSLTSSLQRQLWLLLNSRVASLLQSGKQALQSAVEAEVLRLQPYFEDATAAQRRAEDARDRVVALEAEVAAATAPLANASAGSAAGASAGTVGASAGAGTAAAAITITSIAAGLASRNSALSVGGGTEPRPPASSSSSSVPSEVAALASLHSASATGSHSSRELVRLMAVALDGNREFNPERSPASTAEGSPNSSAEGRPERQAGCSPDGIAEGSPDSKADRDSGARSSSSGDSSVSASQRHPRPTLRLRYEGIVPCSAAGATDSSAPSAGAGAVMTVVKTMRASRRKLQRIIANLRKPGREAQLARIQELNAGVVDDLVSGERLHDRAYIDRLIADCARRELMSGCIVSAPTAASSSAASSFAVGVGRKIGVVPVKSLTATSPASSNGSDNNGDTDSQGSSAKPDPASAASSPSELTLSGHKRRRLQDVSATTSEGRQAIVAVKRPHRYQSLEPGGSAAADAAATAKTASASAVVATAATRARPLEVSTTAATAIAASPDATEAANSSLAGALRQRSLAAPVESTRALRAWIDRNAEHAAAATRAFPVYFEDDSDAGIAALIAVLARLPNLAHVGISWIRKGARSARTPAVRAVVRGLAALPKIAWFSCGGLLKNDSSVVALAEELPAMTQLVCLDLSGADFENNGRGPWKLATALRRMPHVTELLLDDTRQLEDDVFITIAMALKDMPQLRVLSARAPKAIGDKTFGAASVVALADQLPHLRELRKLDLKCDHITAPAAMRVFKGLQHTPELQRLCLHSQQFDSSALTALLKGLQHVPKLEELAFGSCVVGVDALAVLRDALARVPHLTVLALSDVQLETAGTLALGAALRGLPKLTRLNLSGCVSLATSGSAAAAELSTALTSLTQLKHLSLAQCSINSYPRLLHGLAALPLLQHLDVSTSGEVLSSVVAAALLDLLPTLPCLRRVVLSVADARRSSDAAIAALLKQRIVVLCR